MPWIESHTNIADHPKTRKLARRLKVAIPTAVGHLHILWHWALDYAPNGDLAQRDPEDVAVGARFEGEPNDLIEALVDAGFVDRADDALRLHDWDDYAGRYIAIREKRREAARKSWAPGSKRFANAEQEQPPPPANAKHRTGPDRQTDLSGARAGKAQDPYGTPGNLQNGNERCRCGSCDAGFVDDGSGTVTPCPNWKKAS